MSELVEGFFKSKQFDAIRRGETVEEVKNKINKFIDSHKEYNVVPGKITTDRNGNFVSIIKYTEYKSAEDPSAQARVKRGFGKFKDFVKDVGAVAKDTAKDAMNTVRDKVITKNVKQTQQQLKAKYGNVTFGNPIDNKDGTFTLNLIRPKTPQKSSKAPVSKDATTTNRTKQTPQDINKPQTKQTVQSTKKQSANKKPDGIISAKDEETYNKKKAAILKQYPNKIDIMEPEVHSGTWQSEYYFKLSPETEEKEPGYKNEPIKPNASKKGVLDTTELVADTKEAVQLKVRNFLKKYINYKPEASKLSNTPDGKFLVTMTHSKLPKQKSQTNSDSNIDTQKTISNIEKRLSQLSSDKLSKILAIMKESSDNIKIVITKHFKEALANPQRNSSKQDFILKKMNIVKEKLPSMKAGKYKIYGNYPAPDNKMFWAMIVKWNSDVPEIVFTTYLKDELNREPPTENVEHKLHL